MTHCCCCFDFKWKYDLPKVTLDVDISIENIIVIFGCAADSDFCFQSDVVNFYTSGNFTRERHIKIHITARVRQKCRPHSSLNVVHGQVVQIASVKSNAFCGCVGLINDDAQSNVWCDFIRKCRWRKHQRRHK